MAGVSRSSLLTTLNTALTGGVRGLDTVSVEISVTACLTSLTLRLSCSPLHHPIKSEDNQKL